MSVHIPPRVVCNCLQCGTTRELPPSIAKRFKYCSKECKDEAAKKKTPHNKYASFKYVRMHCGNAFCNNTISLLPCRTRKRKHCCLKCRIMVKSKQYPVLLEQKQQTDSSHLKKRIWFV